MLQLDRAIVSLRELQRHLQVHREKGSGRHLHDRSVLLKLQLSSEV